MSGNERQAGLGITNEQQGANMTKTELIDQIAKAVKAGKDFVN
jgi:hypothetical protein